MNGVVGLSVLDTYETVAGSAVESAMCGLCLTMLSCTCRSALKSSLAVLPQCRLPSTCTQACGLVNKLVCRPAELQDLACEPS